MLHHSHKSANVQLAEQNHTTNPEPYCYTSHTNHQVSSLQSRITLPIQSSTVTPFTQIVERPAYLAESHHQSTAALCYTIHTKHPEFRLPSRNTPPIHSCIVWNTIHTNPMYSPPTRITAPVPSWTMLHHSYKSFSVQLTQQNHTTNPGLYCVTPSTQITQHPAYPARSHHQSRTARARDHASCRPAVPARWGRRWCRPNPWCRKISAVGSQGLRWSCSLHRTCELSLKFKQYRKIETGGSKGWRPRYCNLYVLGGKKAHTKLSMQHTPTHAHTQEHILSHAHRNFVFDYYEVQWQI